MVLVWKCVDVRKVLVGSEVCEACLGYCRNWLKKDLFIIKGNRGVPVGFNGNVRRITISQV
jgi:hypothetical protein